MNQEARRELKPHNLLTSLAYITGFSLISSGLTTIQQNIESYDKKLWKKLAQHYTKWSKHDPDIASANI